MRIPRQDAEIAPDIEKAAHKSNDPELRQRPHPTQVSTFVDINPMDRYLEQAVIAPSARKHGIGVWN